MICFQRSLLLSLTLTTTCAFAASSTQWSYYGGAPGGGHYSSLKQINTDNVSHLQKAWTYHTGDVSTKTHTSATAFEATPIFYHQTLYFCTPYNRVIALNPITGKAKWTFNPEIDQHAYPVEGVFVCRGVAAWTDPHTQEGQICHSRIIASTIDGRLFELDANTGHLCPGFGQKGMVNFREGAWNPLPLSDAQFRKIGIPQTLWGAMKEVEAAQGGSTSGPTVINGKIIIGSAMDDNVLTNMPDGVVRAYDATNGKLLWTFHTIPHNMQGKTGAGNVWGPISVDPKHNIVYVGTSTLSPDYWGGERIANIPYANALVALNANTGKPIWHFQTVHHDLYDYDLAAQPTLINIKKGNETIPAVVQPTKTGFLFTFNRLTGKPIFPIEEKPVPMTTAPGDQASPSQPYPVLPKPLIPLKLTADNMWGLTFLDRWICQRTFRKYRYEGLFTPASVQGSIEFPFTGGGINWGSVAFDPNSQLLITNFSRLAQIVTLIPRTQYPAAQTLGANHTAPGFESPYALQRKLFMSPLGIPCTPPPWGVLAAIDMRTGQIKWEHPFGTVKKFGIHSLSAWGSPNTGGSLVTKGGLIFIGASIDNRFHAYDINTGKLLWETTLPAVAAAVPMTYQINGKQYIVVAAGGGMGTPNSMLGDSLVAYKLPG